MPPCSRVALATLFVLAMVGRALGWPPSGPRAPAPAAAVAGSAQTPSPGPAWQRIDTGPFSVDVPPDWRYVPVQGIDSFVGELVGADLPGRHAPCRRFGR